MRRISMPYLVPFLAVLSMAASAQAADHAVLEQKLTAKYRLSTVNAEGEFVTKGTTLVLRKGGFTGGADPLTCIHQYSDGKISLTGPSKAACTGAMRVLSKIPGIKLIPGVGTANSTAQGAAPATRPFVAGEKLYMTKIEVVKDDIDLTLTSDQVDQVRYRAEIRFHKAAKLEVLEAENLIAEVLGVGAGGGGGKPATSTQSTATQPAAQPAAAPAAPAAAPVAPAPAPVQTAPVDNTPPAPIAPPPPPPDQPVAAPPTISPGMTIDQVVAVLGQPTKIVDLGAQENLRVSKSKADLCRWQVQSGCRHGRYHQLHRIIHQSAALWTGTGRPCPGRRRLPLYARPQARPSGSGGTSGGDAAGLPAATTASAGSRRRCRSAHVG